jgi:hypothetical protein
MKSVNGFMAAVGLGVAHAIFAPIGIPSVLLTYGIKGFRPESCCVSHDLAAFEVTYFWPLVVAVSAPNMIKELSVRSKQSIREVANERRRKKWISSIKKHRNCVERLQSDFYGRALDALLDDTLSYLETKRRDDRNYSWARDAVLPMTNVGIGYVDQIVQDCAKAWEI